MELFKLYCFPTLAFGIFEPSAYISYNPINSSQLFSTEITEKSEDSLSNMNDADCRVYHWAWEGEGVT